MNLPLLGSLEIVHMHVIPERSTRQRLLHADGSSGIRNSLRINMET